MLCNVYRRLGLLERHSFWGDEHLARMTLEIEPEIAKKHAQELGERPEQGLDPYRFADDMPIRERNPTLARLLHSLGATDAAVTHGILVFRSAGVLQAETLRASIEALARAGGGTIELGSDAQHFLTDRERPDTDASALTVAEIRVRGPVPMIAAIVHFLQDSGVVPPDAIRTRFHTE